MNAPNNSSGPKRKLPYVIEFFKFLTGFVVLVALALFTLRLAAASL